MHIAVIAMFCWLVRIASLARRRFVDECDRGNVSVGHHLEYDVIVGIEESRTERIYRIGRRRAMQNGRLALDVQALLKLLQLDKINHMF